MAPGELYFAEIDDTGPRPVIVVSRELLNRGRYALVVGCTTAGFAKRRNYPNCVALRSGRFGLTADCVAQCENILSFETNLIDTSNGPIGVLDDATFREVVRAIGFVIGSECEPE